MFETIDNLADDYVHGVLEPGEARRFEERAERDDACGKALQAARARQAALESPPAVEASESLIQETLANVDRRRVRRSRFVKIYSGAVAAIAAASIALIVGYHFHYANLSASPYDLRVVGQRMFLSGSQASLRIGLFDARRSVPLAAIPVSVTLVDQKNRQSVELAAFETNERGTGDPRFSIPDWPPGEYRLDVRARTAEGEEVITRRITLRRESRLLLTSDKPIYQPGQTIRLRSLGLSRPDLIPVAESPAVFTVTDPKGNRIYEQKQTTSRFGIASADCPLADEILEGPYTIACRMGSTESERTVKVFKYALPRFRVDATLTEPGANAIERRVRPSPPPDAPGPKRGGPDPVLPEMNLRRRGVAFDKSYYSPGDTIVLNVRAEYVFGEPVRNGVVEVMITEPVVMEPQAQQPGGKLGTRRVVKSAGTGRDGNARIELKLDAERYEPVLDALGDDAASVQFEIKTTDASGETFTTTKTALVTNRPIRVEVFPESGTLVPGVSNRMYVLTTRVDGRPVQTWLKIDALDREIETSPAGVASFEITPDGNETRLRIRAVDDEDASVWTNVRFFTGLVQQDFLLRTDKAVYEAGEPMEVTVLGGGNEPVFIDLLQDGQTVLTKTIEVAEGRGDFTFDLARDLAGTLQLCAYRFGAQGVPIRKTRTLVVRRPEQLRIEATSDKPEYRPGDTARFDFQLTDDKGRPVAGAISLSAVDEAVYAVLEQRPGLEQLFFSLEEDLLEPVLEVDRKWRPGDPIHQGIAGLLSEEERVEFEEALFALTARVAGKRADDFRVELTAGGRRIDRGSEVGSDAGVELSMDEIDGDAGTSSPYFSGTAPSPHTLEAETYGNKVRETKQEQRRGMRFVADLWRLLVLSLILSGVVAFAVLWTRAFLITAGVGCALLVVFVAFSWLVYKVAPDSKVAMFMSSVGMKDMVGESAMASDSAMAGSALAGEEGGVPSIRVREHFPETLLWRPELITDDDGTASLEFPVADSITTWRMSAGAVSADGKLGAMERPVRVFQPFFVDVRLPVSLTRGDEIEIPITVRNYSEQPQDVTLQPNGADWLEFLYPDGEAKDGFRRSKTGLAVAFRVQPGQSRTRYQRIKALKVGRHKLEVTAKAEFSPGVDADASTIPGDAVRREVLVLPDGLPVERVENGTLSEPAEFTLSVPDDAVPGSVTAIVKLYPSTFSQLVEGLDGIFQQPHGCFEQTSSTTYPNVLALRYLKQTGQSVPEVEAKARKYIHLGYQRLLTFEVPGTPGGFDWYGRPPANTALTAYGLLEFTDMQDVYDVDPDLINRTRDWLLSQRQADGSWDRPRRMLHDGLDVAVNQRPGEDRDRNVAGDANEAARLATTAYIARAALGGGSDSISTRTYLTSHRPETIDNPYVLALVADALLTIDPDGDPDGDSALPWIDRLESLKKTDAAKRRAWWELPARASTMFYGSRNSGDVETTALATLVLLKSKRHGPVSKRALEWLVEQRNDRGVWDSTQGTVLALKALLAGTGSAVGGEKARRIEIAVEGQTIETVDIPVDQSEVMQQLNLSQHFASGTKKLTITETTGSATGYQVAFRYFVPEGSDALEKTRPADQQRPRIPEDDPAAETAGMIAIDVKWERDEVHVDQLATAGVKLENRSKQDAPMTIVELPTPAGFAVDTEEFDKLLSTGAIDRYQVKPGGSVLYMPGIRAGETFAFRHRLRATTSADVRVAPAAVYEYYTPSNRAESAPMRLKVLSVLP